MRTITRSLLVALCVPTLSVFAGSLAYAASTIDIGSFDGSRSSRPFTTGNNYDNLISDLLNPANFGPSGIDNESVVITPAISTASAATLAGDNVFISTEVTGLAASEISALKNFVLAGNKLILVTDSSTASNDSLPVMLNALDGGTAGGAGGGTGATSGTIVGSGRSTNGPFGTIPIGSTFAVTPDSPITPGSHSVVIGQNAGTDEIIEIPSGALGPGSGPVLASSDVAFQDFFIPPPTLFTNPTNLTLFENFIAMQQQTGVVPEPGALAFLVTSGLSGAGLFLRRRVRK